MQSRWPVWVVIVSSCLGDAPGVYPAVAAGEPTRGDNAAGSWAFAILSDPHTTRDPEGLENGLSQIRHWIDFPWEDMPAPAFLVVNGDFDLAGDTQARIASALGDDFVWFPVVGNHDIEDLDNFQSLRNVILPQVPWVVDSGPPGSTHTTYSWDYGNAHFRGRQCLLERHDRGRSRSRDRRRDRPRPSHVD